MTERTNHKDLKPRFKDWRTTAAGFSVFMVLLFGELSKGLDEDPKTEVDYNRIVAGLTIFAMGYAAKDKYSST